MKLEVTYKGKIACCMTLKSIPGAYYIEYLRTAPEFQRQGLASTLLKRAMLKFDVLVALVDPDGTGANHEQITQWLKKQGFKPQMYYIDYNNKKHCLVWRELNQKNKEK